MAHKLVTESMIEKAWDAFVGPPDKTEAWPRQACIRAALEAVADEIVEACARAAIEAGAYEDSRGIHAIRSLKSQGQ